ncbi:MAG: prolipoprotein diacylglyceryl transferase [Deltaproteobacteria bacterium]|jgi:prolipoprotein diacylglyceryl transferase|nr:prolipoprotein diacylglyceryl transferase [Deltaproteobacteria bacterium]
MSQRVWDPDPVAFVLPLLGRQVRWYGIIFALAFLFGFILYRRQVLRGGGTEDEAVSFIIPGFLGTVLGARLGHVLFYNFEHFLNDPLWFFKIWDGGLASHGAAAGLALALLYQSRRTRRPFLWLSDRFAFSAALGAALVRLGNFMNSEIVGKIAPENSPFAVYFPLHDAPPVPPRYPTQLLESFSGFLILGALFLGDRLWGREKRPRGALSALFLVLYFALRFLAEFFKERQGPFDDFLLSRGQLLSILPLALGALLLVRVLRRKRVDDGSPRESSFFFKPASGKKRDKAPAAGAAKAPRRSGKRPRKR